MLAGSISAERASWQVTTAISANDATFNPSRKRRAGRPSEARQQWPTGRDEKERRKEDADGGGDRPFCSAQQVANERRGCEERARRHLAHRDRVEKLRGVEPMAVVHQIILKESEKNISAAEDHAADFEKRHEDSAKSDGRDHRHRRRGKAYCRQDRRRPCAWRKRHRGQDAPGDEDKHGLMRRIASRRTPRRCQQPPAFYCRPPQSQHG